jgi:hypothetical protein
MTLWNGQELTKDTPSLGFTLSSASLIPSFIEQALGRDLFAHTHDTQITPLDDVKNWMRANPYRTGQLFEEVHGLLLGEELKVRKVAEKAGTQFDHVGYELDQMDEDSTFESFDPAWTARIFSLVLEEAEDIQAWSQREHGVDFALAASFQLGDLRKHPRFNFEALAAALSTYGAAKPLVEAVMKGKPVKAELSGSFQLDFTAPGNTPHYARRNNVGFVRVPLADLRAGDGVHAHLALAYSLEMEGLFLQTFDALRQDLALKNAEED